MSDKASASQLQDGPAAGQCQANQQRWYHLCDNIFKKGKKKPAAKWQSKEKSETNVRETTLQTPRSVKKEGEEMLVTPEQRLFPCSS